MPLTAGSWSAAEIDTWIVSLPPFDLADLPEALFGRSATVWESLAWKGVEVPWCSYDRGKQGSSDDHLAVTWGADSLLVAACRERAGACGVEG